jgi:hypothetical protein
LIEDSINMQKQPGRLCSLGGQSVANKQENCVIPTIMN